MMVPVVPVRWQMENPEAEAAATAVEAGSNPVPVGVSWEQEASRA